MCGISGIVFKSEPDWDLLYKMQVHQTQRGPDQKGIWIKDNVGLAHNRLSILDIEGGKQPMESDRFVLVFNGEIYNHLELRKHLIINWPIHSDTYSLLMFIEHKGLKWTLENIDGMFAFACWDKYEKKLALVTDHLSIKPLYYYECEDFFAFASSPGALTHCKDKWELADLTDYLALGATRQPLFSGMQKLMPGCMYLDHVYKWFEYKRTDTDVLQAVKKSIQSVKIADVPVSMFLSGGIDSTVVASQCKGMGAIHLDGPEREYAEKVALKYNNKLTVIKPGDYSAYECLKDYSFQSGDCSMSAIIPYMVSKEVSKYGKVAISSNGADELFFGYRRTVKNQIPHIFREEIYKKSMWFSKTSDPREIELDTYVSFDLNKTLDFAAMCHGLEVRVPYLNRSVIESALNVPRETMCKGHRTKVILKEYLLSEGFNDEFVDRAKMGFSLFSEPKGHEELKTKGIELLNSLGHKYNFPHNGRDDQYYRSSAASFYVWYQVWKDKLWLTQRN